MHWHLGCGRTGSASLTSGTDLTAGVLTVGYCVGRAWDVSSGPGPVERKGKREKSLAFPLTLLGIQWNNERRIKEKCRTEEDWHGVPELERIKGRNQKRERWERAQVRAPRTSQRGTEMSKEGNRYLHIQMQFHTQRCTERNVCVHAWREWEREILGECKEQCII